jgi:hypothetical protein
MPKNTKTITEHKERIKAAANKIELSATPQQYMQALQELAVAHDDAFGGLLADALDRANVPFPEAVPA